MALLGAKKEFLILCGILLAANLAALRLEPKAYADIKRKGVALKKELVLFPGRVGPWRGGPAVPWSSERPRPPDVDAYLKRVYLHEKGARVILEVLYNAHERLTPVCAHPPDFPYLATGWSVLELPTEELQVPGLKQSPVPVNAFYARKYGRQRMVYYLYVARRGIARGKRPFGTIGLGLRKARVLMRPGFAALIQVLAEAVESRQQAADDARDFLRLALPELLLHFQVDEAEEE